jgi:hypothetical protein
MTIAEAKRAAAEANRRRYEELRATGQGATFAGLPPPTAPGSVPIAEAAVVQREEVPAGWYTTTRLRRGEMLRWSTLAGSAAAPRLLARGRSLRSASTWRARRRAVDRDLARGIILSTGRVMPSIVEVLAARTMR